jgi:hypothetical protein
MINTLLKILPFFQFCFKTLYEIWKYLWHGKNIHDELEKLRAENERLRKKIDELIQD